MSELKVAFSSLNMHFSLGLGLSLVCETAGICIVYSSPKIKITVLEKKSNVQSFNVSTTVNYYMMLNIMQWGNISGS